MSLLYTLQTASNESVVQHTILGVVQKYFGIESVDLSQNTDGVLNLGSNNNYLLCEFKFNEDLSNLMERSKVILQAVFYMKQMELKGKITPSILLVADKDECFILHTNRLNKYLSLDLDWSKAASTAFQRHPQVVIDMSNDTDLQGRIWVDNLDSDGKIENIPVMVARAATNQRKVRIHELNIHVIFDDFKDRVLKNWKEVGANRAVGIFMSCLLDTNNNDLSRRNNNIFLWYNPLTKKDERIEVNGDMFDSFWNHFDREQYSISEKERLVSMSDEIIEETNRRFKGEYYTPVIWVDEAHKEMAKVYGDNWKSEYVVWDCACGTGNLTRGYQFKELYMSTLNESDLIQAGYGNENATKFQFDFLNDDDSKLPEGLRRALKDGKVIFLINPPYANVKTAFNDGVMKKTTTETSDKMNGYGQGSKQLYAQFLYRICNEYKVSSLAMFSPSLFMAGSSFKKIREDLLREMKFEYGMMFRASHFADVSDAWGIAFTIWSRK